MRTAGHGDITCGVIVIKFAAATTVTTHQTTYGYTATTDVNFNIPGGI